jgi:ATP-binding cassette subfamily B protein
VKSKRIRTAETEHRYKGENPGKTLLYLFEEQKIRVLIAFIFYTIKHSPTWVIPLLTANAIDIIATHQSLTKLLINIGILVLVTLQNWPMNLLFVKFQSRAIREVENRLRSALVERLAQVSMGFYLKTNAGVLQNKIVRDVENIEQMVRTLSDGGSMAINGVVGAIVITAIKVPLFLPFFLVLAPLISLFVIKLRSTLRSRNEDFREEVETMSARVNEMTTLMPITRAHGLEESALQTMYLSFGNVKRAGLRLDIFNAKFNALAWVTLQLANVSCMAFASYCALEGKLGVSIGDVVLLTSFFGQLVGSVLIFSNLMPQIAKGFASIRSLGEVLEVPDLEANEGKPEMSQVIGEVEFKNVSFTYQQGNRAAIDEVSLKALPGQMIALVGPSGSGKSTLINLIIGFLRPQSGSITIDGRDLSQFDLRTFRKFISVVPQESVLFEGSVRDNITYGLGEVSSERVYSALDAANALEFVNELPDGVDTLVGERGARISGGQKQRLAISRALIRDPRVLILDEATSALDSQSERAIQGALESLMKERTTFVVAHRLSTVQRADLILVLEKGRLVESGRHADLVHAGGRYQGLYEAQAFIGELEEK